MKTQPEIKTTFDLLLKIENVKYLLIPQLAKELGINKIAFTEYILENPKLFYCENTWSYKSVKVKRQLWPGDRKSTYNDTDYVKNKNLGLAIHNVYLNAVNNYRTDEWLVNQIEISKKYIQISEMDNYGHIQGYYLNMDIKTEKLGDDKFRTYAWLNTVDKLQWLKENGFTHEGGTVYGGFGDSYSVKYTNAITLDKINELKALGWDTNKFAPLSH